MSKSFVVGIKDEIVESKMMRMDWSTGQMVEIGHKTLEIGQRVVGMLGYAGSESGVFYCISLPDERGSQKLVEEGFKHRYLSWDVGSDDRPLSKKFGIGLYWDDSEEYIDYRKPQNELDELCRQADEQIRLNNEEEARKKKEYDEQVKMLLDKYKGILNHLDDKWNHEAVKKNIIAYIKYKYPGLKFSVANRHYSTFRVKWKDGPTEKEMRSTCSVFESCTFNGYEDYNEATPTAFTNLFGGIEYGVDTERSLSQEFKDEVISRIKEYYPNVTDEDIFFNKEKIYPYTKLLTEGDFTRRADHTSDGWSFGMGDLFNHICNHTSAKVKENPSNVKVESRDIPVTGMEIVDYSDKCFVVIGDTRTHSAKLKGLGGKFNYRLSCGAGWVFQIKLKDKVKEALNLE